MHRNTPTLSPEGKCESTLNGVQLIFLNHYDVIGERKFIRVT